MDHYSGQSFEHRRQWVVDRIHLLFSLFAIDICAYSIMSNLYHLRYTGTHTSQFES